jgi:cysteine desulfurase
VTAIYLDHFATTPLAPEALAAMQAAWGFAGNPHSAHLAGQRAAALVEAARQHIADLVGAGAAEITFTSGATEANNLAILGAARAARRAGSRRRTIVVTAIEHRSVLEPVLALEGEGFRCVVAPVGPEGAVDLGALAGLVDDDTLVVCVMAANNETGILQPVAEIVALAHSAGAQVHCDGAQAVGKTPLDVFALAVDTMSISSHKLYGPAGVGALYVSAAAMARPEPITYGGGQEQGLRPGTLPAALAAGFGAAARLAGDRLAADAEHGASLEARFLAHLAKCQVRLIRNGTGQHLPGSLNIAFLGLDADEFVARASSEVSISTGSACSSGEIHDSEVLKAMNISSNDARSSVRIFFGRYNSIHDADVAADVLATLAAKMAIEAGRIVQ